MLNSLMLRPQFAFSVPNKLLYLFMTRLSVSMSTTIKVEQNSKITNFTRPAFITSEDNCEKIAFIDHSSTLTYTDLFGQSLRLSQKIVDVLGSNKTQSRISLMCDNDASYIVTVWAVWLLKHIAVPLCTSHPAGELEYFITNSQSSLIVGTKNNSDKLSAISERTKVPFVQLDKEQYIPLKSTLCMQDLCEENFVVENTYHDSKSKQSEEEYRRSGALIVYTSGTTGKPKGVFINHGNIHNNVVSQTRCWELTSKSVMLHCLPLHHIHGIINALLTPLACGATCIMLPKFDPQQVWSHLIQPADLTPTVNMFTAVPTMYSKLIEHYDSVYAHSESLREFIKSACSRRIRLMMSGSAALPESVMSRWRDITGHQLLERYGMTEIGMALSNPLHGNRIPGLPMPGVHTQIVTVRAQASLGYDVIAQGDDCRVNVTKGREGESGDLLVKGGGVFSEYWDNTDATKTAFTADGWFKTGDTASVTNDGVFKIVGRTSVDIIKSGGYKIGALEIERHLLTHPGIAECSVVGVADITWGQKVTAVLVVKNGHPKLDREDVKTFLLDKIAGYKMPSLVKCVDEIPRNAMGKVNKKNLVARLFS